MIAPTRSRRGASDSTLVNADKVASRCSAVRCNTEAQNPSTSPNWYWTAPQVAPLSLAMRLADTAPGSPEANERTAASSIASRVARPRLLLRLCCTSAGAMHWMVAALREFHRTHYEFMAE